MVMKEYNDSKYRLVPLLWFVLRTQAAQPATDFESPGQISMKWKKANNTLNYYENNLNPGTP